MSIARVMPLRVLLRTLLAHWHAARYHDQNFLTVPEVEIFTIKFHYLGDYVATIRRYGTTDSYSTQTGELYHREPKSWYPRTDKKEYEVQLAQIERRKARLAQIRARVDTEPPPVAVTPSPSRESTVQEPSSKPPPKCPAGVDLEPTTTAPTASVTGSLGTQATGTPNSKEDTVLDPDPGALCFDPASDINSRFSMALSENDGIGLGLFTDSLGTGERDDYTVNFMPKLKQHLLPRILERIGCPPDALSGPDQWMHVVFKGNKIYAHKILHINFTTYDVRRDQDIVHIGTAQCNVMLLNSEYTEATRLTTHPYLYGRVLGVYHANISFAGPLPPGLARPGPIRLEFVWIHWYDFMKAHDQLSLDRVSLTPLDLNEDGAALAFVDPAHILRVVHLIPQFSKGKAIGVQPKSRFVPKQVPWNAYFINRFVDRDIFMRYQYGMSVGHTYMHSAAFPPAEVPSIRPDFDFCLEGQQFSTEEESDSEYEGEAEVEDRADRSKNQAYGDMLGHDNEF